MLFCPVVPTLVDLSKTASQRPTFRADVAGPANTINPVAAPSAEALNRSHLGCLGGTRAERTCAGSAGQSNQRDWPHRTLNSTALVHESQSGDRSCGWSWRRTEFLLSPVASGSCWRRAFSKNCRPHALTLSALQLGELPVKPRTGVPNPILDFVDAIGLESQPVDDLLGHVARMIAEALGSTATGQPGVGAKAVGAVIGDDLADTFDE